MSIILYLWGESNTLLSDTLHLPTHTHFHLSSFLSVSLWLDDDKRRRAERRCWFMWIPSQVATARGGEFSFVAGVDTDCWRAGRKEGMQHLLVSIPWTSLWGDAVWHILLFPAPSDLHRFFPDFGITLSLVWMSSPFFCVFIVGSLGSQKEGNRGCCTVSCYLVIN